MSKSDLNAFVRRVSRYVERVFDKEGEIAPVWFVTNKDDDESWIGTPQMADHAPDVRDQIAAHMCVLFREQNIMRYVLATEAWLGAPGCTDTRPSLQAERREVVIFQAEDTGGGALTGLREIVRPQGRKPYLARLELTLTPPGPARFSNLLRPECMMM
jgi:hypothetical protein